MLMTPESENKDTPLLQEDWNKVFAYFERAWDLVLDWLEESCGP
jgi:hypothetical protein